MGTVSVNLPSDGQTADAADYNVPINTIVAEMNGALDSDNIEAGGVTPNSLVSGTGTSWAWQAWVPVYTLTTTTNSTTVAKYTQVGKIVFFRIRFLFGAATAFTSSFPTFSLPVTARSDTTAAGSVILWHNDVGNANYYSTGVIAAGATTIALTAFSASGTYVSDIGVSSTVPFTWGSGDSYTAVGYYEVA